MDSLSRSVYSSLGNRYHFREVYLYVSSPSLGQIATAMNMRSRRGFAFCRFKLVLIYYIVSRKCHLSAVPVTAEEPETTIWSVVATSEEVFDSIPRRKGHGDENIKINICEHRSEKAK